MVKSGFKDPTAIKKQHPKDHPEDGKNTPWDFRCPQYDERTSCFINAGTHYGVGHRQPVGHEGNPAEHAMTMPEHRAKTMKDDRVG
jgi:hypothetical protein